MAPFIICLFHVKTNQRPSGKLFSYIVLALFSLCSFCLNCSTGMFIIVVAIVCRPSVRTSVCLSVCLSVTLVDQDHISRKSWKLIARTISPTPSLFLAQRPSTYSQGNIGKFWEDYRWGGKSVVLEHKSDNISETRKDRGKVTMEDL